jgi:hypothetical protein
VISNVPSHLYHDAFPEMGAHELVQACLYYDVVLIAVKLSRYVGSSAMIFDRCGT